MADYVGALAAIKQRFAENWTATPIGYVNGEDPVKIDSGTGMPAAWILFEVVSSGSNIVGTGTPGNQTIVYDGLIKAHVFVPVLTETELGMTHAVAAGEVFRNKVFYNDTPGTYVRTWTPRIDEGNAFSDDGSWFGVTATTPFEYWHRG